MGGDELKKVSPGERIAIPARTFNTFIDAAKDFRDRQAMRGAMPTAGTRQAGVIQVQNVSSYSLDRFSVVELTEPLIDPDTNSLEFQERVRMQGDVPGNSETICIGILLEPLDPGAIGWAVVSGVAPCWLEVHDPDHRTCSPIAGVTDHMETVESDGVCDIVWVNDDAGGFVETAGSGEPGSSSYKLAYVMLRGCGRPPPNGISGSGCTVTFVSCVMLVPPSGSGESGSGPGPCGYDLVVQYTEYDLATCSTVRTYCVYNPDDCCDNATDLIVTDCCPDGIPRGLTITGDCLPAEGVTITWNGELWSGEATSGSATLSVYMTCAGDAFTLQIGCSDPGGGFSSSSNPVTSSCDPVDLRFSGEFAECGDCATGSVEFVITE